MTEGKRPPKEEGGHDYTEEQINKARETMKREKAWRKQYPQVFKIWVHDYALQEAAAFRRIAMQAILENIRRLDMVGRDGGKLQVSNDFGAIWARLLLQRYPYMKRYLTLRTSVFDVEKPKW